MPRAGRRIYGVITAQASNIEPRELLEGIITAAQRLQIDTAILTNVYNPVETMKVLETENHIYDLILSDEYDGLILILETITNPDVRRVIFNRLKEKTDLPIVVLGTPDPGFLMPQFHYITTSDHADLADITSHLIEEHGFTDIHILTGQPQLAVSRHRVEGYRHALEAHGIPFSEKNVFYGDFWLTSGHEQARRYISGELPFPQALICCNDYMAYGFLDECMEQDVPIPETTAVIGYEYVRERLHHDPILTTYRRNRKALGEAAVRLLTEKLTTGHYGSFTPPRGTLIPGDTCGCGASRTDIKREIRAVHIKENYDTLNLYSQLEHRLTECRSIDEFVARCWEFQFMIRDVSQLRLCLYENWFEDGQPSENMVCYNLLHGEKPMIFHAQALSRLFEDDAAPYYFCPLFFAQRSLGYVMLRFASPDTFDPIFRNWLKSISNGLEFLRMKNDILYLNECRTLSEKRDTLTGMYNAQGLQKLFLEAERKHLYLVALRIEPFDHASGSTQIYADALLDAAEAVREFCGRYDNCARISDDTFLCLIHSENDAAFLEDRLTAILYQHPTYIARCGVDSFACSAAACGKRTLSECRDACLAALNRHMETLAGLRRSPHYLELEQIRTRLYLEPALTFDSDKVYALYRGSSGYLRQVYKACYGITLHDDCIAARTARAKFGLSVTQMTLAEVALHCGYHDVKYFMRQFQRETGITAVQYRILTT